jgi:hypothetical protein
MLLLCNLLIPAFGGLEPVDGAVATERLMLRDLAWQMDDDLTRAQLGIFHAQANEMRLSADARRQALGLDEPNWAAWAAFLLCGPLPAEPAVPEMLRRLGEVTFRLSVAVEGAAA